MTAQGWEAQGMAGGGTRFAPGKGLADKGLATAFLGPVGLFASARKEVEINVTWTRTAEAAAAAAAHAKESKIAKAGGPEVIAKIVAKAEAGQP